MTRFELFIPLAELDGSNLLFCDLQPMIYNDGNWGSNLGLGFRWHSPTFDRVFGLYGYFDYRETTYHRFQQGTLGFDSMGNWIDARGNVYLPTKNRSSYPRKPSHRRISKVTISCYGGYESAMLGGDVELGVRVPEIGGRNRGCWPACTISTATTSMTFGLESPHRNELDCERVYRLGLVR